MRLAVAAYRRRTLLVGRAARGLLRAEGESVAHELDALLPAGEDPAAKLDGALEGVKWEGHQPAELPAAGSNEAGSNACPQLPETRRAKGVWSGLWFDPAATRSTLHMTSREPGRE